MNKRAPSMVLFWKRERKKAYIAGLGRDQLEHLASPMTKSECKYQRVQDKSETSPSANTNESKTIRDNRKTSRVRTTALDR